MTHLTPDQQQLVDAEIALGHFTEPAEVIDAALQLLADRQAEYDQLQLAISQVEQGNFAAVSSEAIKQELHRRLNQRKDRS